MQVSFSRYGSSAFSRRKRGSTSGSSSRSRASDSRSSGVAPAIRSELDRSRRSRFTTAIASRSPWSCCRPSTRPMLSGPTFGLPSRSPPIQLPNRSGRRSGSGSSPSRRSSSANSSSTSGTASACRPSKYQTALRASSTTSGRAIRSSSVCHSRSIVSSSRAVSARARGGEQVGDLAKLVEDGAARRLGRVRSEHGPYAQPADLSGQLRARDVRSRDPVHRLGQPAAVALPHAGELAPAVHLLGHVRQVEVRAERAHQPDGRRRLNVGEERRGRLSVRADQRTRALHQLEQLLALLADERSPEQGTELADVASEAGVALRRLKCDSCDRWRTRRGRRGRPAPR